MDRLWSALRVIEREYSTRAWRISDTCDASGSNAKGAGIEVPALRYAATFSAGAATTGIAGERQRATSSASFAFTPAMKSSLTWP